MTQNKREYPLRPYKFFIAEIEEASKMPDDPISSAVKNALIEQALRGLEEVGASSVYFHKIIKKLEYLNVDLSLDPKHSGRIVALNAKLAEELKRLRR